MGLPFLLEEICGPILGIYKSLADTRMWKLGLRGLAIPRKGIYINGIAVAVCFRSEKEINYKVLFIAFFSLQECEVLHVL
jgi:hypothetical protein